MNRAAEIAGFLATCGWESATHEAMAADFSPRRYARLTQPDGRRAILMDADANQSTPAFVAIARLLRDAGLSAPEIVAADPRGGLVLLEDFGDGNVGRLMDEGAASEPFYMRAAEVLAHVHQAVKVPVELGLPVFDAAVFAEQVSLFLTHYVPFVEGREVGRTERDDFAAAWREALCSVEALPQCLMLRDFMPDNVMDLRERDGVRALGLLDFQDGGLGPIAYDVASFCEVVRRDGGNRMLEPMLTRYVAIAAPTCGIDTLRGACITLSAQRHMRILGILANQIRQGRTEKRAMLPRVKKCLRDLLADEALRGVASVARDYFRD